MKTTLLFLVLTAVLVLTACGAECAQPATPVLEAALAWPVAR